MARNAHSRRRRHKRHRNGSLARPDESAAEAATRTKDQEYEGVEGARRLGKKKARVVREGMEFVIVVGLLSLFLKPVAWIVGIFWGMSLASDFVKYFVEPQLRERYVDREVSNRLDVQVHSQRRRMTGEHNQRMEALAAGVAHEIRNPIAAAKSLVQQMGEDPGSGENVQYAGVALEELDRVEKSISHLLRYAREEDVQLDAMRMSDVVHSAVETFDDRIERIGVDVGVRVDTDCTMTGDPEKLRRVLVNLIGNALDALEHGGPDDPHIEIQAGENLAGSQVWVRVRDNGPGIAPERIERIFHPFYTSKESGTGLGLAIAKKLVDAHGGAIEAQTSPEGGTEFLLTFPKQTPEVPA